MTAVNARDLPADLRRLLDEVAAGKGRMTILREGATPVYVVSEEDEHQLETMSASAPRAVVPGTPSAAAVRRLVAIAERTASSPEVMENAKARGGRTWTREDLYDRE